MNNKLSKKLIILITIIISIANLIFLYKTNHIDEIFIKNINDNNLGESNLIDNYYRQTLAFANLKLYFLDDASSLQKLDNPYIYEQRKNINYLFDTSYYKGHYYSYYTILPILFILLPIYLITHKFLNLIIVNWIILSFIIYFTGKLYYFIMNKYIKNISNFRYILGLLTILFGSNIFLLLRGLKYDIAVSCGILFIILSIYLIMLTENKKNIRLKYIFAGITTGFVVLSKPSYIIYYLIIFYIFGKFYIKYIHNKHYLLYYITPIIIIALMQMGYNYLRFDSIFEFGIKYQLTGFSLQKVQYCSIKKILRGLKFYTFQLPIFTNQFPYIIMSIIPDNSLYSEFLYEHSVLGLISFPSIVLSFVLLFFKRKKKDLIDYKIILILLYIIFIIIVIINTTFAGVSETYSTEFKLITMFSSIIYIEKLISISKNNKYLKVLTIVVYIINILLILPISYSGEDLYFLIFFNTT